MKIGNNNLDLSKVNFKILEIEYSTCLSFCQQWHYSKTCPPGYEYFGLYNNEKLIAVICYGTPAMRNQLKCYGVDVELRRLCCIDDTPKNTESYFISHTLKIIKNKGYKKVLSLADPSFNHTGNIYKATNFKYMGEERGGGSRDIFIDGIKYHSRSAFAKFGASGIKKLKKLFPNKKIEVKDKPRKFIYVYEF